VWPSRAHHGSDRRRASTLRSISQPYKRAGPALHLPKEPSDQFWDTTGALPAAIYRGEQWTKPEESAKTLPTDIERRFFPDTRITAYRLAA
jgi:hypothetical protein